MGIGKPSPFRRVVQNIWGAAAILYSATFLVGFVSAILGLALECFIAALAVAFLIADLAEARVFVVTPKYTKALDSSGFATKGETFIAMAFFILVISTFLSLVFSFLPQFFAIAFSPFNLGEWTPAVLAFVMAGITTAAIGLEYRHRRLK